MSKISTILAVALTGLWVLAGCDDMTSVYEKYKGDSPIHYTSKVKNVLVRPGFNRAELSWPALNDPTIRKVVIEWGNGNSSANYDWDSYQPFVQEIDNLPEGSIIFNIATLDKYGNSSLTVDVSSVIYGDMFRSSLEDSQIVSGAYYADYLIAMLEFYHSSSPYYKYLEMTYKDGTGADKTITIPKGTNQLKLDDIGENRKVSYRSVFSMDENALEDYASMTFNYEIPTASTLEGQMLDKSKISPLSLPDDARIHSSFSGHGVKACFDGRWPTYWTQEYMAPYHTVVNTPFPSLFSFDLGGVYVLTKMTWYPRHIFCYGHPRIMEIYGALELNPDSSRPLYDSNGVLDPYWKKLATLESFRPSGATVPSTDVPLTEEEKQVLYDGQDLSFPLGAPRARFIRVRTMQTWGGGDPMHSTYVECNEITLYGVDL